MSKKKSVFTTVVHADHDVSANHGAFSVPIYNASVFAFENADEGAKIHNFEKKGFFYGRLGNPTQEVLEKVVCELEHAESALAFASGMAATSATILSIVKSGDHIVAVESMYSTTTRLLKHMAESFNINITFVDATDAENYRHALTPKTRMFWIETPSNPLLNVTDISTVANIAKEKNIVTIADNTFASPINQKPLDLGVDLVIHSATKYLGGHSDLTAGLLAGKRELVAKVFDTGVKLIGGSLAPQVAWLILRGIKTLAIRINQQNKNAYAIAHMLKSHPKVDKVYYPGFTDHKNYEIAKKQMDGFGAMVSFDVAGGAQSAKRFIDNLEICSIATSLGGVETIVQHARSMTHATISKEERAKARIFEGLIRMSVGIEDKNDLIADIEKSLDITNCTGMEFPG